MDPVALFLATLILLAASLLLLRGDLILSGIGFCIGCLGLTCELQLEKEGKDCLRDEFSVLLGKPAKIIVKDHDGQHRVFYGVIRAIGASHLLEEDRFGRLHMLNLNYVVKVTELKGGGRYGKDKTR